MNMYDIIILQNRMNTIVILIGICTRAYYHSISTRLHRLWSRAAVAVVEVADSSLDSERSLHR